MGRFFVTSDTIRKYDFELPIVIEEVEPLKGHMDACNTGCNTTKIIDPATGKQTTSKPRFYAAVHSRLEKIGEQMVIVLTINSTPINEEGEADR